MQMHTSSMYFKWTPRLKYLHAEEHDLNKTSWQNILSNPNTLTYTHTVSFDYYIHSTLTSIILTLIWFLMLTAKHLVGPYNMCFQVYCPCEKCFLVNSNSIYRAMAKKNNVSLMWRLRQLKDILARNIFLSSCPRWRQALLFDSQTWFMMVSF